MSEPDSDIAMVSEMSSGPGRPSILNRSVYWILCLIVVFSTLAFGGVDPVSWVVIAVLTLTFIMLWAMDVWKTGTFQVEGGVIMLPLIGLILIGCIQLLPVFTSAVPEGLLPVSSRVPISMDPFATRAFVSQLLIYTLFLAAAFSYVNTAARLRLTTFLVIGFGAVLAFAGILQRLASPDAIYGLRPTPQAIPFGPFVNQHHFAALMEMTGGLALAFVFRRGGRSNARIFFIIAVILMGVATVMTSSRGGILSFVAVMSFVLLMNVFRIGSSREAEVPKFRTTRNLGLIAGASAMVLLIAGSVLYLGADSALMRGIGLGGGDDISNGRAHFWPIAISIFLEHPILGAGLDAFGVAFTRHDTWAGLYRVEQAHNDYLQILADAGIAGFACLASFIFLLFRKGSRLINSTADRERSTAIMGALAGCFGILIHSFFDFPLRTTANAFVFMLLTVIATATLRTQSDQ